MKLHNNNGDHSESLLVHFRRIEGLKREALTYQAIALNNRQLVDLELLLNRAYYPLAGYNSKAEYESIVATMRLPDNSLWPLPICLDLDEKTAAAISPGQNVALNDPEGFMLAVLTVSDIWQPDKKQEALKVYGTDNPASHPEVQRLYENKGDWYVGGQLEGLSLPIHYDFKEHRLTPAQAHRLFADNGWRRILGVQSRGYMHQAEKEMILAAAREAGTSIFLQPEVAALQPGDRESYCQIRCAKAVAATFPKNMMKFGVMAETAYQAGPRGALQQALLKRNFGCSHFLVAPNHDDPFADQPDHENFYPAHLAQEMVAEFAEETGIEMVPAKPMVYVDEKAQYLPLEDVPPGATIKTITNSELRRRLEFGLEIPAWFTMPEVVAEMRYAYPPRSQQGFTIFITGLSGAGKSTLARALLVKLMEMRTRPVTLLDGDIVRHNLSSELGFSREHRQLNVTRIGFVASEITKNGGIAICAPIAPYEESRRANRELISRYGGYIEIFMATPLATCEQRDRKGLYAKAKAGKIQGFTGVNDPYIVPANPEITMDTTNTSPMEAAQEVLLYLEEQGYLK
ncbi:MAG: bifunctional sulfate adenylyltransferase/adenylylsulfate kinase [Desulfobulbaceae bacterium]|nr:bifunctional sulfate adenylyltransferase/adenylylsulfate kinase [Desulfobulbaceae bacterium]